MNRSLLSFHYNSETLNSGIQSSQPAITFQSTVIPNSTNKLQEILSLDFGYGNDKIENYCDQSQLLYFTSAFGMYYGPRDFFVDKNENIYILEQQRSRVLKFKNQKLRKIYNYGKYNLEFPYPYFFYDNKENLLYISEIDRERNKIKDKVFKITNNDIVLLEASRLPKKNYRYEIKSDKNNFCNKMWFKDNNIEILFDLKINNCYTSDFEFIGIDENYNFYFRKRLINYYQSSEKDKVKGIIIIRATGIVANQGFILYKYNSKGELKKEVNIDDPIPYDIKINSKGDIYLSACLHSSPALLEIPLDKYRIYKFTM